MSDIFFKGVHSGDFSLIDQGIRSNIDPGCIRVGIHLAAFYLKKWETVKYLIDHPVTREQAGELFIYEYYPVDIQNVMYTYPKVHFVRNYFK